MIRTRVHPGLAVRNAIAEWLINHSGRQTVTKVSERLHALTLYALGYGSAVLSVDQSGERHVLALLETPEGGLTVFDVGAHRGSYALMVHAHFGHRARIHCFEPDPHSLAVLRRSVAHIPGATAHPFGLGAQRAEATLYSDTHGSPMASVNPRSLTVVGRAAEYSSRVALHTVTDVCEELSIDRVDLLKIDVEGAELEVLHGARPLLEQDRIGVIQFEFGYGNVTSRTFLWDFKELLEKSHDVHRVGPLGLMPLGPYALRHEVFVSATNYVAIPKSWRIGRRSATRPTE